MISASPVDSVRVDAGRYATPARACGTIRTPEAATINKNTNRTINAMTPALMTYSFSSLTSAVAPRISMTWTRRPSSMTSSSS